MKLKIYFLIVVIALFSIQLVSSLELNNIKVYDELTKTATIKDSYFGKEIMTATLKTPQIFKVGYGDVFKVFEFEVTNLYGEEYKNFINGLEFIDLKTGKTTNKIVNLKYKVLGYNNVTINEIICEPTKEIIKDNNGTICSEKTRYEIQEVVNWYPIEKLDLMKGQKMTIGGFTYVNKGEIIEWIPTLAGKEVEEWATWTSDLNTDLVFYQKLDETSGTTAYDSLGWHNFTNVGVTIDVEGKIGRAYDFEASDGVDRLWTADSDNFTFTEMTLSAWAKPESTHTGYVMRQAGATTNNWYLAFLAGGKWGFYSGNNNMDTSQTYTAGNWYHIVARRLANGTTNVFINGVGSTTSGAYSGSINPTENLTIGNDNTAATDFDGIIDEVGLWSRALTDAEISDLYNGGSGITYSTSTLVINLLTPINDTTTGNPSQIFVCNASSDMNTITNISLIINNSVILTNSSGFNGTNYTFSYSLPSASYYIWRCGGYDSANQTFYSTQNYTINYINNLNISSISPINNYYTNNSPIQIIGYGSDDTELKNVSLVWNAIVEQTNSSGVNNSNYYFSKTISTDGNYTWSIIGCDDNACSNTLNRTITFDSTTPSINLTNPKIREGLGIVGQTNNSINWTIVESNPDTCWYVYNSTSKIVNCSLNGDFFQVSKDASNITFYANDSIGYISNETIEFNYSLWILNETHSSLTTSGALESLSNYVYFPDAFGATSVILNYNGTNYTTSTSDTGDIRVYLRELIISSVSSQQNITFYYNFIVSNSSGSYSFNTPTYNQTINPFNIGNCSTYTNPIMNFSMYDEDNLNETNGTINFNIQIYSFGTENLVSNYNDSITYVIGNNHSICLETLTQNYTISYSISFYGESTQYLKRYKNLQRGVINPSNTPLDIDLYNLNESNGLPFLFTIVGNILSSNQNTNLLVDARRQYLALNNFISVESSVTDISGKTILNLIPNSEVYEFIVSYNGEELGTFTNYKVQCSNQALGQCYITLNLAESSPENPNLENYGDISLIFELDTTTNTLYTTFSTLDDSVKEVRSVLLKSDGFLNETICDTSQSALTGILNCPIPAIYENTSFYTDIYVDGEYVGTKFFSRGYTPNWYGADIFVLLLSFTSIILLFMAHPVLIIIGSLMGLGFPLIFLWITGASWSSVLTSWIIFAIGGIIAIVVMNKKQI